MTRRPPAILWTLAILCLLPPAWLALPGSARAPAIEDPGPHPAGWRKVSFDDRIHGQGRISARIYYPALSAGQGAAADPAAGPYPLVAFMHGWLGDPSNYDGICLHLASWGFLVSSTGTETGLFPDTQQFARDTRSLLAWTEAESADPASWLAGMADGGDWSAAGHSMGGATLSLLIGIEPRIRVTVGLQPAFESSGVPAVQSFTGRMFQVAGSADWVVPAATVHRWFEEAHSAQRKVYFEVQGMGHLGCVDNPPGSEPLPGPEQHRLHRRLLAGILRAEVEGEENLYADILGEGIAVEPVRIESGCIDPPFWARESLFQADSIAAGLGGAAGNSSGLAWSLAPAAIPTPYGLLGLDISAGAVFDTAILGSTGVRESLLPVDPAWSGRTLFLQGIALAGPGAGRLTRTAEAAVQGRDR